MLPKTNYNIFQLQHVTFQISPYPHFEDPIFKLKSK